MKKRILTVYKSKYGSTKKYAQWIAESLKADLMEAKQVKPEMLKDYDLVIYGGGLYAGGVAGVKLVTENACKQLVVFTVGLADPAKTDYSPILQKNFTPELLAKTKFFHLRGGVDYASMGLVHKMMMGMMKSMIERKPEAEREPDSEEFLKTYGKKVDFTDEKTIEPLVNFVQAQG